MDQRVEELQRRCVARPGVLSFAGGLPAAATFPLAALATALGETERDALQYDWPEGREGLRRWIAARLRQRGADVAADDVLVTSGAQQALDIAVQLTLPERRRVAVPEACYPGALELFSAAGAELVGTAEEADLYYAMPAVENPMGRALPRAERAWLLGRGSLILEDDAYAELRFDDEPPPAPLLAAARDRVLHVGTLSKTLCPGLRIGWLVTPPRLRDAGRRAKLRADLQGNSLAQSIVERYLEQEDYDGRLVSLRSRYSRGADALMGALRRHIPECNFEAPEGGFSLWVTTPEAWDEVEVLRAALAHGTSFDPGSSFRRDGAKRPFAMRLAFSTLAVDEMEEAAKRLARAFRDLSRQRTKSSA
ncbi:MAG TPA: PLP-dependent aminotransferase family protein [Polyangiaceae bacterium]|nr:PLP-dependent aminotransferase family protein [Polyangiaceae bacterium]